MQPTTIDVTPQPIFEVAQAFMASKYLYAANELGLFELLPGTLAQVAARSHITPRAAHVVLDALVALGLLQKKGETYENTPATEAFLTGKPGMDLRAFLRFWNRISYDKFSHLEEVAQTGTPLEHEFDAESQAIFCEGVASITLAGANALAEAYSFARHRRVLDLGGGVGTFLEVILRRNPSLRGTLFDQEGVAKLARERLGASPEAARIEVVAGDFFTDPIPTGHDAVVMANIVHYFSNETNTTLFRRLRDSVTPGARALIVDFWTDPSHTEPPFAALMAGEFFINLPEGDVYSRIDASTWFAASGWREVEHVPLAGPQSLVVAEAI